MPDTPVADTPVADAVVTAVYQLPGGLPVAAVDDPELRRIWTVGYQGNFRVTIVLDDKEKEIDVDDRDAQIHFYLQMWDTGPLGLHAELRLVRMTLQDNRGRNITIAGSYDTVDVLPDPADQPGFMLWSTLNGDVMPMDDITKPPMDKPRVFHKQLTVQTGIFTTPPSPDPVPPAVRRPMVPNAAATPGLKFLDVEIHYIMRSDLGPTEDESEELSLVFYVAED